MSRAKAKWMLLLMFRDFLYTIVVKNVHVLTVEKYMGQQRSHVNIVKCTQSCLITEQYFCNLFSVYFTFKLFCLASADIFLCKLNRSREYRLPPIDQCSNADHWTLLRVYTESRKLYVFNMFSSHSAVHNVQLERLLCWRSLCVSCWECNQTSQSADINLVRTMDAKLWIHWQWKTFLRLT